MLLPYLLFTPLLGVLSILMSKDRGISTENMKLIALITSILNFFISLVIFILFDFSTNQFQFVQEYYKISYYDFYLGIDGLSIYFVLLTTLIIPISLLCNWKSITKDVESFVIIILLLESLLLTIFIVLDILLFYIFFESILPPLFILIGLFGSDNRVKASFYLFLYTLWGSLFLLISILAMSSIMSATNLDTLFKGNFIYLTQLFLFYGIFIAFAVKTPTIFLNTWLLKAHVESPLGGSILLAAIVLKLSLYGILRLILPLLPKAYIVYTNIIFLIGVITIIYASLSTLRTIDIKELIAYSSVSHAAVYLLGVFSNSVQGIEGAINLGLAHGLVSPGLFISAGGVLYDRSHTRVIALYKGVTQVMPLFSILFFILCLSNCGAPLSLNFIGEFLSLYGVFERSSLWGVFASSSIIFSAAYTIFMYQRIAFGGVYSRMFTFSLPDLTKREFTILLLLVIPTILFGIYPAPILDAVHYSVSTLIYSFDFSVISCDAARAWVICVEDNGFTGLNFSNIASILSVATTALFLHLVYLQLVKGKAIFGYPWALAQPFSDYLRILNDKCTPGLQWALSNPTKSHAFSSMPLQSSIFTINRNFIIGLVSSIITAAMGYAVRLIILNYLEYDVFTNLDNWIASLSYFCSLGGIRFVINECLKENTFLMSYCGGPTGVSNPTVGSGSLPVGINPAGNISPMQAPNGPGSSTPAGSSTQAGSSTPAGSSGALITDDRSKLQEKILKVEGKLNYFSEQYQGAKEDIDTVLSKKFSYTNSGRQEQWLRAYDRALSALNDCNTNLSSEWRMHDILKTKLAKGDYTMPDASAAATTKRSFTDSSMSNDASSTSTSKRT